jgi:Acetylglutamate kinase
MGILPEDYPVTVYSLTGYSGGGKKMIAQYEAGEKPRELFSPRIYGLSLHHKHLPEMQKIAGLAFPPVFNPVVDDYYKGMIPKMKCCVDAIAGGVERVHILDGRIPHSILVELLSDEGIGTMLKNENAPAL